MEKEKEIIKLSSLIILFILFINYCCYSLEYGTTLSQPTNITSQSPQEEEGEAVLPALEIANQTINGEVLDSELEPSFSYLSPVFNSTLSYISQVSFAFSDPDNPQSAIHMPLFDFSSYLVNDNFIPRFLLQGIPLEVYKGDIIPPAVDPISEEIYVRYQRHLDFLSSLGVQFYNPGEEPVSYVRTIDRSSLDSSTPVVIQYLQKGYDQDGNVVIAFLYKFLNPELEISDYVYGSYKYDNEGNLNYIDIYKYEPLLKKEVRYLLNISKTENGYTAVYKLGDISKKTAVENYQAGDFNGNKFEDAKFDIVGYTNGKPTEAYHIELDDYSPGFGEYLGVFQVKAQGINDLSQLGFTYTRYLPEKNAEIILNYSGLADPQHAGNQFNFPDISYVKNTSEGKLILSFKSPQEILRKDMDFALGDKIIEIFNQHKNEIDYSIKLVEEENGNRTVYNFLSFQNGSGEKTYWLTKYENVVEKSSIKEVATTYEVDSSLAENFGFSLNFKEEAEIFIQTQENKLLAETTYETRINGDDIEFKKESFGEKEDGTREWQSSTLVIGGIPQEISQMLSEGRAREAVEKVLSEEKLEPYMKQKKGYLLKVTEDGEISFFSGYAMERSEGGEWLPASGNMLLQDLNAFTSKAGIDVPSDILSKIESDPYNEIVGFIYDHEKSSFSLLKSFGPFDQRSFTLFGKPWCFKIEEYNENVLDKYERRGMAQITVDGKFVPLFYLKKIGEGKFEVERDLETEAPLLFELLRYTGKMEEFSETGEVEIALMQEVYDIWENLNLGKAGDSSLLNQIKDQWPSYIELLESEGKRAGFTVEVVAAKKEGEKEVPTVIKIHKIETEYPKEVLEVSVDKGIASSNGTLLNREITKLKQGEAVIEENIVFNYIDESLEDRALFSYLQYKLFGGMNNFSSSNFVFTFDNLGRLRRYICYSDEDDMKAGAASRVAPLEIFLPYINPLAIGASQQDQALRDKLLAEKFNLEDAIAYLEEREGLWLEREDENKPFNVREVVDRDGDGVVGDPIEVVPELTQRGLELGSLNSWNLLWQYIYPTKVKSWEDFLEGAINADKINVIYNSGTVITDINEVKDENGKLKPGTYTFTLQPENIPLLGLDVDSGGVKGINFIGSQENMENMVFTPQSITYVFPNGEDQDMRVWERNGTVEKEVFDSPEEFRRYLSEIQSSMENFTLKTDLNGRKLEEKGVDISDLLLTMRLTGIRPILPPDKQSQTVFSSISSSFLALVDGFKTLAGIVQSCDTLDSLTIKYFSDVQELKVNFWNHLADGFTDVFGKIGKGILDRVSVLAGRDDEGVIGKFPVTQVYMNQNNISLQAYGAMVGATKLDFSQPLRGAQIKKGTFGDKESFKKWVNAVLGDVITEEEADHLWMIYDELVNIENQPWMFYKFLRGEQLTVDEIYYHIKSDMPWSIIWPGLSIVRDDPGDPNDRAKRLFTKYNNYYNYTYDGRYKGLYPNAGLYRELTFPQPGDEWAPRAGQLVLNEKVLKVKWSHLLSVALMAGSYFLTPYLQAALVSGAQRVATWLGLAERGTKLITGLFSLPVAGLNAVRISSQFLPFTTAMMWRKGVSWVDWFNGLGDQILHNAAYSFAFGMFFNPSLLGMEIGILPAIGKLGQGLIRIGDKLDEGISLLHHIGGGVFGGLGRMWYWAGNYGDKLTKLIIGTQKTPLGEVARTTLSNPRYIFYLYLTESTIEEGLVPSIVNWQLREGVSPGRTHIGGSRRLLATLARAQMLCTENAGNIAEMTDPLESPFFLFLLKPFMGMLMDYHAKGELDDYFKNLFTFLYPD